MSMGSKKEVTEKQFSGSYAKLSEFDRTHLVQGSVPDTLGTVDIGRICTCQSI